MLDGPNKPGHFIAFCRQVLGAHFVNGPIAFDTVPIEEAMGDPARAIERVAKKVSDTFSHTIGARRP